MLQRPFRWRFGALMLGSADTRLIWGPSNREVCVHEKLAIHGKLGQAIKQFDRHCRCLAYASEIGLSSVKLFIGHVVYMRAFHHASNLTCESPRPTQIPSS